MLVVKNLGKSLGTFSLRDVSFEVAAGDYFVLLGASGVGKTVLLETLAGLLAPDRGEIWLDGVDITYAPIQRRRLGLVYQDQALFPHLTVGGNIGYGPRAGAVRGAALRERVRSLAESTGAEQLLDRYPASLSGGEAQRVALARALATEPRCLLLDEPLCSLDRPARGQMRSLLRTLHRRGGTILHVTHDYEEALSLATRVAVMDAGTVVQVGVPKEVFSRPKSEFVARFIGMRNFFSGRLEKPDEADSSTARFIAGDTVFRVLTRASPGPGRVTFRSEDVSLALEPIASSARNCLPGTIVDLAPSSLGVELTVHVGVEVVALVTEGSVERMGLQCGQAVWIGIKASAIHFIED